jgi:hypothetical protein
MELHNDPPPSLRRGKIGTTQMNPLKQYKKLQALNLKAEQCLSREEAQEILKKANKAHRKVDFVHYYESRNEGELAKD